MLYGGWSSPFPTKFSKMTTDRFNFGGHLQNYVWAIMAPNMYSLEYPVKFTLPMLYINCKVTSIEASLSWFGHAHRRDALCDAEYAGKRMLEMCTLSRRERGRTKRRFMDDMHVGSLTEEDTEDGI